MAHNKKRHSNRNAQQDKSGRGKVKHLSNDKSKEGGKVIKEKFKEEREFYTTKIEPKNVKQKEYLRLLNDPSTRVIIVEGLFGTGKTWLASCVAGDKLRKGEIERVIVARPYVQTGKTSGFKPGSSLEKLYAYVRNVLDTIKSRIGQGAYELALKDGVTGTIEVQEVESIRGRSFDEPSFLIIDEAQQTTPEEMESILTRVSDNCTLILCGDDSQRDIQGVSGLSWVSNFCKRHNISGVGRVNFNSPDDIIRGGLVREVAIGLAKDKE